MIRNRVTTTDPKRETELQNSVEWCSVPGLYTFLYSNRNDECIVLAFLRGSYHRAKCSIEFMHPGPRSVYECSKCKSIYDDF